MRYQRHRATAQLQDGFGAHADGEDRFDALIGLLSMIGVVDGRRLERPANRAKCDVMGGLDSRAGGVSVRFLVLCRFCQLTSSARADRGSTDK
jgi:hypothetical protein